MFHRRRSPAAAPQSGQMPGAVIRPIFSDSEVEWLVTLDIALTELAPHHRLAPQLSISKMVTLPGALRDSARHVLRHRADFTLLDRFGFPVAVIEIGTGAHARDTERSLRWQQSRQLLEGAGIACYEITPRTTLETLFAWIAKVAGTEDDVSPTEGTPGPEAAPQLRHG